jgi:tetratricopeptide (TPR) repeat protein
MWFCAAFLLLLQTAPASPAPDLQAQALKALDQKQYAAAAALLEKAIAADPKNYAAHFNLALAYSLLDRDADAAREYKTTLNLKPGLYEANLNLGIVYLRDQHPQDAIPLLKQAVETKPAQFRPLYYLAEALLEQQQYDAARVDFTKAIALDPKSASAEAGLGRAELSLGHLDEAGIHLRKAAALDASYNSELLKLGERFEDAKQYDRAAAIYRQFADDPAVAEHLGQVLLLSGKAADAIPQLERAVTHSPTTANRIALATAYVETKQTVKGLSLLAQAIEADPKNYDARMLAGRILRDQHRYPEAASQFLEAAKIEPNAVDAWKELTAALIVAQNYPPALAALDRLKALGVETVDDFYLRGMILDNLRQLRPALEYYQKFLASSHGRRPNEEFKARQRSRLIQDELNRR